MGSRFGLIKPSLTSVNSGLEMSKDLDNLALTYLAVLQGLALGVGQYLLHQIVVIPTTYTHAPSSLGP